MTSVSKIEDRIKEFVMDFNRKYSSFPLITFQFVSLNEIPNKNSKLIWWTFCHKDVALKYYNAVKEFTGYDPDNSTSKVTRTLIKWEHNQQAFWYEPLGDENVIENTDSEYLYPTKHIDPIGAFEEFSSTTPEKEFLDQWKNILNKTFDSKGATMWVSMQHSFDKDTKIPSHVFCLFNKKISDNYKVIEVYREIEKFIVDYLIDLYKTPVEEQRRLVTRAFASLAEKVDDKKVISGNSKLMSAVINKLEQYSKLSLPILLLGPKGTGKSYFAEEIIAKSRNHYEKDNAYFEINCSKLNQETAYRELFGYNKGAFTGADEDKKGPFEIYTSGTILLDEVGSLTSECQKMLNIFLEKKYIVRMGDNTMRKSNTKLILASNLSLQDFREKINEEFYDRIATLKIFLPSLKEHGDNEVGLFAKTILKQEATSEISFSEEALIKIKSYSYPGNFRELKNCIKAAVELAEHDKVKTITPDYLFFDPDININTDDEIIPFPTPSGAKWSELKISFLDNENVSITIKTITKRVNYAEMGFKDKRTSKPNKSWKVLFGFALTYGQLNKYGVKEKSKIEKSIQRLEEALIKYFNIGGDPIPYIEEHHYKGYKTAFIIEGKSHNRECEDSIRKMYRTIYPKEDERKEDTEGDNDNDSANPSNHEDD